MNIVADAIKDTLRAYEMFSATKAKMHDRLLKDTEKLNSKYRDQEIQKYTEGLSSMRINFKRTLDDLLMNTKKAVNESSIPAPLSVEQMRMLDGNKYFRYSPAEWAVIGQKALESKDLGYLRAVRECAKESGVTLSGCPMTEAEGIVNLEKAIGIAKRLSDDGVEDPEQWEQAMKSYASQAMTGMSLFDESGDLKRIEACTATEDPFVQGLNSDV